MVSQNEVAINMGWLKHLLQDATGSTHSWKVQKDSLSHDREFPETGAELNESRANCRHVVFVCVCLKVGSILGFLGPRMVILQIHP